MTDAVPPTALSVVDAEIAATPLPTRTKLRNRASLQRQLARFLVLNVKILKLSRQHHAS